MKTYKYFLILIALLLINLQNTEAQNIKKYKSFLSASIGSSDYGIAYNFGSANKEWNGEASYLSTPVINVNYDYMVNKRVSLGIGASYQFMNIKHENYIHFADTLDVTYPVSSDFGVQFHKFHGAMSLLFHYPTIKPFPKRFRLDLHSGIRLGATYWLGTIPDEIENYDTELNAALVPGLKFAPQIIILGLRSNITQNMGVTANVAYGSPYVASVGIFWGIRQIELNPNKRNENVTSMKR